MCARVHAFVHSQVYVSARVGVCEYSSVCTCVCVHSTYAGPYVCTLLSLSASCVQHGHTIDVFLHSEITRVTNLLTCD